MYREKPFWKGTLFRLQVGLYISQDLSALQIMNTKAIKECIQILLCLKWKTLVQYMLNLKCEERLNLYNANDCGIMQSIIYAFDISK